MLKELKAHLQDASEMINFCLVLEARCVCYLTKVELDTIEVNAMRRMITSASTALRKHARLLSVHSAAM